MKFVFFVNRLIKLNNSFMTLDNRNFIKDDFKFFVFIHCFMSIQNEVA